MTPPIPLKRWVLAVAVGVGVYLLIGVGLPFIVNTGTVAGLLGWIVGSYLGGRILPARGWKRWLAMYLLTFGAILVLGAVLLTLVFGLRL